jgi:hypothetical protein
VIWRTRRGKARTCHASSETAAPARKEVVLFKKKNQETVATAATSSRILRHPCAGARGKSYCFFFQKEALSYL